MQSETAETVSLLHLRLVNKRSESGIRKLFYKKCLYNLNVNYQDLATSDKKDNQNFTSDTEIIYNYFNNKIKKLIRIYNKSRQPVKVILFSYAGLRG